MKSKTTKTKATVKKVTNINVEIEKLDLLSRKLSVTQQMLDLRDKHGNTYFSPKYVMKNIIGLTDAEIAE